ncbi:MAG: ABC transporter ATP-binding protein [Aquificae bacterium]|nr:ABC transporter ATP-binding protein [Aquificota bacterium]
METIKVTNLKKRFRNVEVLKGVSLSVRNGEITAVLGPNASGKTTLLKCILGLVIPDEGTISVMGENTSEGYLYRRFIGYMPQEPNFPPNLTPRYLLELVADIRGFFPEQEVKRLVDVFKLGGFMDKPIGSLSGGTKQKVNSLLALAFNPEILILDEPTIGLDPLSSSKFKEEVLRRKDEGKTVLLTSHIMGEVEELADRVLLMIEGSIRIDSSVGELKERTGEKSLERALAKVLEESFA